MSRGTILIVDDSEVTLEVCRAVLQNAGYKVATVSSPLRLTPAIREHNPQVILLDVHMPALSGEKAAQILGQYDFSKDITVLLHSSLSAGELNQLVERTGVAGYICKSPTGEELVRAVDPWFRAKRDFE